MAPVYKSPSKLLDELGITTPAEIDIEAIAQYCNATVLYQMLTGCEARLIGSGERAIITVNVAAPRYRQRFSAAHELAHWLRDRGKVAFSCSLQTIINEWRDVNTESAANEYAADLLLPKTMFERAARDLPITFESVDVLADQFQVSRTATAIRLVQHGSFPSMLIFSQRGRRKWFVTNLEANQMLWPKEVPGVATVAADLIKSDAASKPTTIQADGWINHPRAHWYEVVEHTIKSQAANGILTLLWWKNEKQVLDVADEGENE